MSGLTTAGFLPLLLLAFGGSAILSLGGLRLGRRLMDHPVLRRLGARAHARKMRALDTVWPMTLIRPAAARGDVATIVTVITALVAFKSAASLVLGLATVFWLPLASLIVPTIVAAEDPDDPVLLESVQGVARLQVTSHVAAAALGFAMMVAGPLAGRSVGAVLGENVVPALLALMLSAGFALAAGRREALTVAVRLAGRASTNR